MSDKLKAAMVVILDQKRRALILKRSPGPHWMPEKWALVGGHIEEGELPEAAVIREAKEETTLVLKNLWYLKNQGEVAIYYSTEFSGEVKIDFEHIDWQWVPYDELHKYDTTPNLEDTIKLALGTLDPTWLAREMEK
jgi:8-oxo-dGTP pyrophosphatase MutT (NUDIX family)